jgi:hypothetical protein
MINGKKITKRGKQYVLLGNWNVNKQSSKSGSGPKPAVVKGVPYSVAPAPRGGNLSMGASLSA